MSFKDVVSVFLFFLLASLSVAAVDPAELENSIDWCGIVEDPPLCKAMTQGKTRPDEMVVAALAHIVKSTRAAVDSTKDGAVNPQSAAAQCKRFYEDAEFEFSRAEDIVHSREYSNFRSYISAGSVMLGRCADTIVKKRETGPLADKSDELIREMRVLWHLSQHKLSTH